LTSFAIAEASAFARSMCALPKRNAASRVDRIEERRPGGGADRSGG
jgi:hypothetical protein